MKFALLYDFDGCIAHTDEAWITAFRETIEEMADIELSDEEIMNTCYNRRWGDVTKEYGITDVDTFRKRMYEIVTREIVHAELFPNIIETLTCLKGADVPLGIGTSNKKSIITEALAAEGLAPFFSAVIAIDEVTTPKPDPETFLELAKQLGVEPENCIVIGDSKNDMIAAEAMGAKKILFHHPDLDRFSDLNELKKTNPDFVIADHAEILDVLKELGHEL